MRKRNHWICLALFSISCLFGQSQESKQKEFRGVWIATVDHIDWPSRGNYETERQKAEFISILDMHQRNGMNAVVMQIDRPQMHSIHRRMSPGANGSQASRGGRPILGTTHYNS